MVTTYYFSQLSEEELVELISTGDEVHIIEAVGNYQTVHDAVGVVTSVEDGSGNIIKILRMDWSVGYWDYDGGSNISMVGDPACYISISDGGMYVNTSNGSCPLNDDSRNYFINLNRALYHSRCRIPMWKWRKLMK